MIKPKITLVEDRKIATCPKCKSELKYHWNFCVSCGEKIDWFNPEEEEK